MRIRWVTVGSGSGVDLSERERQVLEQLHGVGVEVVAEEIGTEAQQLAEYLATVESADFVYAEVTPMQAIWAYARGETFGVVERNSGDMGLGGGGALYHVHDGIFDLVWSDGGVFLPGEPGDPLPERWRLFEEGLKRLGKLAMELGDEDS